MKQNKIERLVRIAVGSALIVVGAWISIPVPVPGGEIAFTLQTFAVLAVAGLLGFPDGLLSVLVYILLGACGVLVFAGFQNLYALIARPSAGYVIGFVFMAVIVGAVARKFGRRVLPLAVSMTAATVVCYAFGTLWFWIRFQEVNGPMAIGTVLMTCVVPYLIPDIVKLLLALTLVRQLYPRISRRDSK